MKLLCCLRSIVAHRDHFVRRLSVCACVCLSDSHTFLIVTHSYVSQATNAFLGMLPLCCPSSLFKLGRHVDCDEKISSPINFRGQQSSENIFKPVVQLARILGYLLHNHNITKISGIFVALLTFRWPDSSDLWF